MNVLIAHGFESNYTVGFARGLASNGVKLVVLSCDETERSLSAAGIQNVNIRGSQSENRSGRAKFINLLCYYWKLLLFFFHNRRSTIHFTGIFRNKLILFEGIILSLVFRALGHQYIYTAHNILPHNRERSRLFRRVYRVVYSIPHFIVVHTQGARRALIEQFGVPDAKIRVISIGLNEEVPLVGLNQKECRVRLGCDESSKLILFFGRIDEYKGLDLLIEAFDSLRSPATRLVIAGAFRSVAYGKRILGIIASARRRADIRLDARLIPNDEVGIYFSASDVVCLPYRQIYQSGLLFLALRFGKPIVTTDVGSLAEFVTRDIGLVTHSNDAQGIANALMNFFASQDQFPRERVLAIAEKYRWDHVCQILLPLYEPSVAHAEIPPFRSSPGSSCF